MTGRHVLVTLLTATLLLGGCSAPQADTGNAASAGNTAASAGNAAGVGKAAPAAASAAPAGVRALPEAEQMARAFAVALGKPAPLITGEDDAKTTTRPARLLWQGDTAILITTSEIEPACHACTGGLGVYYLAAAGDGFAVTDKWPAAIAGNGFGALPEWSISTAFSDRPVIFAEAGYTAQGCTSGGATLTELTSGKPVTSALIRTIYENDSGYGDDNGASIEGKIANIVKDRGFDVIYSGARAFTEHWNRKGETFVKTGGETAMPQC